MSKSKVLWSAAAVVTISGMVLTHGPAKAQTRRAVRPERSLLGVSLGRPFMDVIRRYKSPKEVQTVALATSTEQLPGLGGGAAGAAGFGDSGAGFPGMGGGGNGPGGPAMMPGGGFPGMSGGPSGPGSNPYGGGGFGGGGNGPGGPAFGGAGIPVLPPGGGFPGMGGGNGPGGPAFGGDTGAGFGDASGFGGGFGMGQQLPEYSNAILWIYKPGKNARLEFLINEDGRVAQISAASPAATPYRGYGARTSRGIQLGSTMTQVMAAYGNPERHRLVAGPQGPRFYELYYTKNHHAAFTVDTQKNMKVVRITIALAD